MKTVLEMQTIEKRFFGIPVLRNVSLSAGEGQVVGLVGENGAGKSTLMNIAAGCLRPDGGSMLLGGQAYAPADPLAAAARGVGFIHQELNLFSNLSVAENLFLAAFPRRWIAGLSFIDRKALRARAREVLAGVDLDVSPDTLVARLAPGERQLVEIAKALITEARVIIFDEPTTSLTPRETERLFELIARLRGRGIAVIYISHVLADVFRLSDAIVVLRDGAVVGEGPSVSFDLGRLIALMVGRSIDQVYPPRPSGPSSEPALEVLGLSQPGIVEGIGLTLWRGEVLGLFGLMGSGRTELARILFGLDPFERGEIRVCGRLAERPSPGSSLRQGLAFLTEDRREEGLLLEASVEENLALVSLPSFARRGLGLVDRGALRREVDRVCRAVGIRAAPGPELARRPVKTLSGGNQQKVVLAKWLLSRPVVFILDEPTRGVDVGSKCDIYGIINELAAGGTGILFISSEIEELIGMCDRILVLNRGELRATFSRAGFDREAILRAAFGERGRP